MNDDALDKGSDDAEPQQDTLDTGEPGLSPEARLAYLERLVRRLLDGEVGPGPEVAALREEVDALRARLDADDEEDPLDRPEEERVWMVSEMPDTEKATQHGREFPRIGGKLRLLRQTYGPQATIKTRPSDVAQADQVGFQASLFVHDQLIATGHGTATQDQERVGNENLVELAETRAIARCLRFAGFAVDAADFTEVEGNEALQDTSTYDEPSEAQKSYFDVLARKMHEHGLDWPDKVPTRNGRVQKDRVETQKQMSDALTAMENALDDAGVDY